MCLEACVQQWKRSATLLQEMGKIRSTVFQVHQVLWRVQIAGLASLWFESGYEHVTSISDVVFEGLCRSDEAGARCFMGMTCIQMSLC
jgi:hypothetical protein